MPSHSQSQSSQSQKHTFKAPPCCRCNGIKARCKFCACAKAGRACTCCLPAKHGKRSNGTAHIPDSSASCTLTMSSQPSPQPPTAHSPDTQQLSSSQPILQQLQVFSEPNQPISRIALFCATPSSLSFISHHRHRHRRLQSSSCPQGLVANATVLMQNVSQSGPVQAVLLENKVGALILPSFNWQVPIPRKDPHRILVHHQHHLLGVPSLPNHS